MDELVIPEPLENSAPDDYSLKAMEDQLKPASVNSVDAPCDLGYMDVYGSNVHFRKTATVDTIFCRWQHPEYGWLKVMWVDGQIDWNCVGFTRRCESFQFTVEGGGYFCIFTVPGGVNCENQ